MASLSQAGGLIAGGKTGTRVKKEWERAADAMERKERYQYRLRARNRFGLGHGASTPSLGAGDVRYEDFVITRGPIPTNLKDLGDDPATAPSAPEASFDAMEQQCRDLFAELDTGRIGMITMEALESSFHRLHSQPPLLRMSRALFERYVAEFFPEEVEGVPLDMFVEFHRRVWKNQPLAVRRGTRNSVQELYNSELVVREAYSQYDKDRSGLPKEELPSVLQDLGLHLERDGRDRIDKLCERDFGMDRERLGFHDFVRFKNSLIDRMQPASSEKPAPRMPQRSSSTPSLRR